VLEAVLATPVIGAHALEAPRRRLPGPALGGLHDQRDVGDFGDRERAPSRSRGRRSAAASTVPAVGWISTSRVRRCRSSTGRTHQDGPSSEREGGQEEARRTGELIVQRWPTRCNGSGGAIPLRVKRTLTGAPLSLVVQWIPSLARATLRDARVGAACCQV
jgi:hypothetical protein